MKLRTTLILVVVTGAILAYIFTQEKRQPGTRERLALETHPFQFKPADADEIEIERKDDTLRLLLRDGSWHIREPFNDPADPDLVKQILEAAPAVEWVETIERKDLRKEDLKRSGLGEDEVTLTVRRKGSTLAQASFGASAALDGCVYASVPAHKERIHVAKTTVLPLLRRTNDEWRDPRLTRLKAHDILRLTMNAGASSMEFTRSVPGQPWQFVKPIQTRCSDSRINEVIGALLNLKVKPAKINMPAPTSGPDLPKMTITMEGQGLVKPVVFTLHPNADPSAEVQVQVDSRQGVFLGTPKLADFWVLQPNLLRDENLVRIPKEQTTALRIRSPAHGEVVLDKKGDTWMLTRFGKVAPANEQRIAKLIDTLNATPVLEFLSDAAGNLEPWGLHQPFLSIEWQAAGKSSTLEFGKSPHGIFTARVREEPFIYRPKTIQGDSIRDASVQGEFDLFRVIPPESLRWRGTKIINVSIFTVRRIVIAEGDKPALTLLHNPDDASWAAAIAGRDVSSQLDRARANQLLQKLVDFQASDWGSDRGSAMVALQNPSLTIQLLLSDRSNPTSEPKPLTLTFAPFQPGKDTALYHGRKDQEPDTFLITRDLYRELIAPVVAR